MADGVTEKYGVCIESEALLDLNPNSAFKKKKKVEGVFLLGQDLARD